MKTEIHGNTQTKVKFISETQAKVVLPDGNTYIIGFCTPFNYLAGPHFIRLTEWLFDFHLWCTKDPINVAVRNINSDLYRDEYEMIFFIIPEQDKLDERKRIGDRIKELRKKKNVDAKDLAQRIGIDASNLSRIELGKYSVGLDVLTKIANALDARVELVENTPTESPTKVDSK